MGEDLEKFIEALMKEKGFDLMPEEMHKLAKRDLLEALDKFIIKRTVDFVPDEHLEELNKYVVNEDYPKVQELIARVVPDLDKKIISILSDFKFAYLSAS